MNLSNVIAGMISEMLNEQDEIEFQRNTLAQRIGCVPSQINYVLSSRFTPERGYLVESRRGGGGCIRIVRLHVCGDTPLMHTVNAVGAAIDEKTCRSHLLNLVYNDLLSETDASLMLAALSEASLHILNGPEKDEVRAAIFKQMLLTVLQNRNGR